MCDTLLRSLPHTQTLSVNMNKRYKIVYVIVILFLSPRVLALDAGADIKLNNWLQHERIVEIRELFSEIQSSGWKESIKNFDYDTKDCFADRYPVKYTKIIQDPKGMVRKFSYAQIVSHGQIVEFESYYDAMGNNRFVYYKLGQEISRIYLNKSGNVFWGVTESSGKTIIDEYEEGVEYWVLKFKTSDIAKSEYQSQNEC